VQNWINEIPYKRTPSFLQDQDPNHWAWPRPQHSPPLEDCPSSCFQVNCSYQGRTIYDYPAGELWCEPTLSLSCEFAMHLCFQAMWPANRCSRLIRGITNKRNQKQQRPTTKHDQFVAQMSDFHAFATPGWSGLPGTGATLIVSSNEKNQNTQTTQTCRPLSQEA